MADLETRLNLEQDEPLVKLFLVDNGGRLARDEEDLAIYWLEMRPLSAQQDRYYVRLAWRSYPYEAPSIKFADAIGGAIDITRAWPSIPGYRPGSFDICKPMSAEGYELHAEWRTGADAWPTEGNPFLWVVGMLQFDLDNQYGGRAA